MLVKNSGDVCRYYSFTTASVPGFKINPARFYDNNEDALADMKRLADQP